MPFWGQGDPPPPFWGHEPVPTIDVESARAALDSGVLLIDLGNPDEWLRGHLPNAFLVEPEMFDLDLDRVPKDRPIIVAGRDVGMEEEVVGAMRERGYDAAALEGGVGAWRAAGCPLVRADGKRTG